MAVPRNASLPNANSISTRALRKQSLNSLSLSLCLGRLGRFLQRTLPQHANDSTLIEVAAAEYKHIVRRLEQQQQNRQPYPHHATSDKSWQYSTGSPNRSNLSECCRDELSQIDNVLEAFLASPVAQLPPAVVFEVHSLRGLVQDLLRRNALAQQSYLKALWIALYSEVVPREQLVLTMHHLGKTYGTVGDYSQAVELLEKVVLEYGFLKVPQGHACFVDAKSSIQLLKEKWSLETHQKMSSSFQGNRKQQPKRLSFIQEEENDQDRCLSPSF